VNVDRAHRTNARSASPSRSSVQSHKRSGKRPDYSAQELSVHIGKAPTVEEKVREFIAMTGGRSANAPGRPVSCYDFLETLLQNRLRASREAAAVICLGLSAGLPSAPEKPPAVKTAKENARQIVDSIRSSQDPTYGGNVLPVIRSYTRGNDEARRRLLYGLLCLLKSRNVREREMGQTVCLGFLLFGSRHERLKPTFQG
jgi:hypothetical protein